MADPGLRPAPSIEAPSTPEGASGGGHVLIVEDNREVGQFALQLLSDFGYTTTWAENGVEALRLIEGDGEEFDVVFSDVVMPGGMSGVDLANKLRRLRPALPVILTSGYSDVLAEGQGSDFELLRKPYSAESLSRLLRKAMSARSKRLPRSHSS